MHHVSAKYLSFETREGLTKAESAFRQALDLNPDLAIAHKSYAQLEVDLGRATDAFERLLPRARGSADSELFAALVSPLRYCGMLQASSNAHRRAIALEPKIRTCVAHTWFLQHDYNRLTSLRLEDSPYIVGIALAGAGRQKQAIAALTLLEEKNKTRLGDFARAARTMIENDSDASVAAVERIVSSEFSDPEGLYYLTRHLSRLNQADFALDLLERVVAGGFFCYPALLTDPWLDPIRTSPKFVAQLKTMEKKYHVAEAKFSKLEGDRILQTLS